MQHSLCHPWPVVNWRDQPGVCREAVRRTDRSSGSHPAPLCLPSPSLQGRVLPPPRAAGGVSKLGTWWCALRGWGGGGWEMGDGGWAGRPGGFGPWRVEARRLL